MDQKMMKTLGAIIAGFVVFILILFLISSCTNHKYTYDKLESKMMEVAKTYFEVKKDELPALDKDSKTLTLKKMISDGKIEELTELFDDENVKCDGNVTVTNNNGFYVYSPYLSCGKDYETKYLKDKIIEDSLVEEGFGLYEVKDSYIMKGEVQNNFVKFNEQLFRIVRINENGTIRLYQVNGLKQKKWDDRYNPDIKFNSGINEYEINGLDSRLKESIEAYYNDSTAWPDEVKGYITTQDLCIGKRSKNDVTKDGSTECSKKLSNQPFGVLAVYEYLQATLDSTCSNTLDKACKNYNWIARIQNNGWTLTADAESSQFVYTIYQTPLLNTCSASATINAVFNLTEKAVYVSGTGTETDPYIFK